MMVRCPQCRSPIRLTDFDRRERVVSYLCGKCAEIVRLDLILDEVHSAAADAPFQRVRSGRTVLVADGSGARGEVAADILRQADLRVLTASDGAEAWDRIERHHPDLVVTELMLSGLSAYDLLRRLKADARLRDTRVLIMSRVAKPEVVRALADMGAAGFLDEERLVETLAFRARQVLSEPGPPRPEAAP